MRKVLVFCLILILYASLGAQVRTGNIYGRVIDSEGNPLPGVTVTLTGMFTATMTTITAADGNFRFLSLAPSRDYALTAELQGFTTKTEEGIIVALGANVNMSIVMEVGSLEEEVTVTAITPIIDTKTTSVTTNVSYEVLQSLPTARDPWVIIQLMPSVMVDRENVGGSESGQQTSFVAHGETRNTQNVWAIDGAVVTDVSSAASPIYFDFDSFEEMNVTVGGSDVTTQTGGVSVNLVTRRGGNRMSLAGRFFLTDEFMQAQNLTDDLRQEGIRDTNKIENIKDFGFNLGGPLVRDKAWLWFSYGVQDIKFFTIMGTKDDSLLTNYNLKLNLQLAPQNRMEIFGTMAAKEKWGRGASYATPLGTRQKNWFDLGSPVFKIQDEHMFGDNLFMSAKFTYVNSGFWLLSMFNDDGDKIGRWNVANAQWDQHQSVGGSSRPRHDLSLTGSYFNNNLFGASHEIKFGGDYSIRKTFGSGRSFAHYYHNYNAPTIDTTGDGSPNIVPGIHQVRTTRYAATASAVDAIALFVSDSISTGPLNFNFGLRYDLQKPWVPSYPVYPNVKADDPSIRDNFTPRTAEVLARYVPGFDVPEVRPDYRWSYISPRIGINWDIRGDGKFVAKLAIGQYSDYMMTGESAYFRPLGVGGWVYYWWLDLDGDGKTDYTELFWHDLRTYQPYRVFDDAGNFIADWSIGRNTHWGAFDPFNPVQTTSPTTTVDKNVGSVRTRELIFTLERELLADLGASINVHYRKYDRFPWNVPYYPATGHIRSSADFVQVGTVPNDVGGISTGEAAGRPYYLLKAGQAATSFEYRSVREDYYRDFYGVDFIIHKRLSHKWMLNASFSLQGQTENYASEKSYLNPTNIWAMDGQPYGAYMGSASGKIDQYVHSRWMLKLAGLYQLPYDINFGWSFMSREGNLIEEYYRVTDYTAPNPNDRTFDIQISKFGKERLPIYHNLNMRLEKTLHAGDYGRIWIMADLFNVFNASTVLRRYQRFIGTLHNYADPSLNRFVPNPTNYLANEILNPRTARIGLRFQY